MKTLFLFSLPVALLAVSEVVPESMLDPIARLGATSVLGFIAIWGLTRTLPAMMERMDRWEKQRYKDSEKLNETLQDMRTNCETTLSRIGKEGK